MALPSSTPAEDGEPRGETYGAVILAAEDLADRDVREVLRGIRFTGWMAPPQDGRIVILGDPGDGVIADGRRGVIEVGGLLAAEARGRVLAVRVRQDRQLGIVAWRHGEELGRYCSDPSREPTADDDVLAAPFGVEIAEGLAELSDRADAAEQLTELLEEELDPESVYESERLRSVLRLLGLPTWIVAAGALPHDIPTGPKAAELTRLRGGATGISSVAVGRALRAVRRRQHPPAVIADPPKGGGARFEEWMF
ncbi:hypothetical protein GCM10009776_27550 [Microbacterium deminutum]|uniref:Uncharacterized protein n=2 Tax=Microbacterium deminutum TaxID=344164 RepID=A0ABP5CFN0_9MICO